MKKTVIYTGLTSKQAEENLHKFGKNIVSTNKKDSILKIFLKQFKSPLIYVLLAVSGITFLMQDYSDSVVVMLVVLVNSVIGTLQSRRTNNTLEALKKLSKPFTNVFRDGKLKKVHTENIVREDVVFLEPGDIVPADGVILEANEVQLNESQLTGESLPVFKVKDDEVFKGTVVYSGSVIFKVEKVGVDTEIGKLTQGVLENINQSTNLEKELHRLVKFILITILILSFFLSVFSFIQNTNLLETFKTIIALAVSAIPEGLPVVMTLVLAIGAWRLSKVNALLKNLPSGASLATVSFVCTDKTGTLTKGDIVLEEIIQLDSSVDNLNRYILGSLDIKNIGGEIVGDILDKKVYEKIQVENLWTEEKESPFTSENKYNAKEFKIEEGQYLQIYKGAPELFGVDKKHYENFVLEGKRVLCVGISESKHISEFQIGSSKPLALLVFEDELRLDVATSVADIKNTGVKVMLITGDNILTAKYIATKVGILDNELEDIVLEGRELDLLTDSELEQKVKNIRVIARAKPDHKFRVVKALQGQGEVVAMTGDGVNDGPALSLADIGIAMGKIGTEVAKEASDLILVDDNFASIVKGIFEARVIIENIKKTIIFLFSTSLGEIVIISGTIITGLPIALLPAQILWLNLITDGFLDIAIANEKAEDNVKKQNYTRYQAGILNTYDLRRIFAMGLTMGVISLLAYVYMLKYFVVEVVRTLMLVLMSVFQWMNAFNVRKHFDSVFTFNIFSNKYINIALVVESILLLASVYTGTGNRLLTTVAVEYWLLPLLGLLTLTIVVVDEVVKAVYKSK